MILAAAGFNLEVIIYIAAAVWGVISWFRQRNAPPEQGSGDEFRPAFPQSAPRPIQQGESEEERLRRFLEALGVPSEQAPPKPRPQPPVQQPKPLPRTVPQPQRPTVVQPRPTFQQPRPIPQPKPRPVLQEQEEIPLAGRLEEPAAAVESVSTEFDAMAAGVALPPIAELQTRQDVVGLQAVTAMDAVTGSAHERPVAVAAKSVQAMLRSPESLRTAFVLGEILGPPKSATH